QDIFNAAGSSKSIQSTDQPHLLSVSVLYQTQKYFGDNKVSWVTKDWQLGIFTTYGSALPLTPPASTTTNNLPGGSVMYRTGQPLYSKDLNCHCYDPQHETVLNPAAWVNPAAGTYGAGPVAPPLSTNQLYYSDLRGVRRASESFNILRSFKIGKGDRPNSLSIRADFTNIFNRTINPNPTTSNPAGGATKNNLGQYTAGFGVINQVYATNAFPASSNTTASQLPRQGTLVARFNF